MKVVLAEKPSVARDIAHELQARSRKEGYLEGNGWAVTWAFGHMVELREPEEYDPAFKRWSLETLPILPEPFQLRARGDKDARRQLDIIRQLFRDADEIVCATDAGREGELIFRYIQHWAKATRKPFRRLWISSLTPEAIRRGFAQLAPGTDYDNLYRAARCRSEADWIVGINATRFFTVFYGGPGRLWSLGRVQTPVLAMIVTRDHEIEHFTPEDYWEVHTSYRQATFKSRRGRFTDRAKAEALVVTITPHPLTITRLQEKEERTPPPLLYDLTALQKDMNARWGFTADQTLKLAQALYEKKNLTYPRTDSRYLSSDIQPTIAPLLQQLQTLKPREIGALNLQQLNFTKRIVNDAKVSDHHAIIPTDILPAGLSDAEQKVYDAVLIRLIAAFYPPCIKRATQVDATIDNEAFRASGKVLIDPGWQALYPPRQKKSAKPAATAEEQTLPQFTQGESGPHQPKLEQKQTKPPRRFTEATLLQLMETAGKTTTDETLREALKERGIGTPATRASIIETLLQRAYIRRDKKNLLSTAEGRHLIGLVLDERLKSAEMTGAWEARLKAIEQGNFEPETFMRDVVDHTRTILQQAGHNRNLGPCPRCGKPVIRGNTHYGCSGWNEGCSFTFDPAQLGLSLEPGQIAELLHCGRSLRPCMIEQDGQKKFVQILRDGETFRLEEQAAAPIAKGKQNLGTCPICGGAVLASTKAWSCSNWRNGCPLTIWKTVAGKKLNRDHLQALLSDGQTPPLTGFTSKAGKKFDAALRLENGRTRFIFGD